MNFNLEYKYKYHTNAGSGSCNTMINPNATKISAKFTRINKQQTPLVLGQNYITMKLKKK